METVLLNNKRYHVLSRQGDEVTIRPADDGPRGFQFDVRACHLRPVKLLAVGEGTVAMAREILK